MLASGPDGPALGEQGCRQPVRAVPAQVQLAVPLDAVDRSNRGPAPVTRLVHLRSPSLDQSCDGGRPSWRRAGGPSASARRPPGDGRRTLGPCGPRSRGCRTGARPSRSPRPRWRQSERPIAAGRRRTAPHIVHIQPGHRSPPSLSGVEQDDLAVAGEGSAQGRGVVIHGAHEVLAEHRRRTSGDPGTAVAEACSASLGVLDGDCVLRELGHDASVPREGG